MEFFWFLLFIVVIGALAYGATYYMRRRQAKEIEEVNVRKQKIMAVPIADTIYTLKNLNLTGQTKRTYETWNATWQTITRFRFPEIEAAIVSAEQYTERLNFVKASQTTKLANEMIDEAKVEVDRIFSALQKLLDSEKQNRAELEQLQENYSTLRKDLLAHSFSFGDALETLEKRLSYLELDFAKFNTLTNEGDHLEAKEVLSRITKDMKELEEIIDSVPKYFKEIETTYEEQVVDLKEGYQRMVEEHYLFSKINVDEEIQEIEESIKQAKEYIATTDLDDARKQMDKTSREIDSLYNVLQTEIDAKEYVNAHQVQIEKKLDQVMQSNRYVNLEIDRVAQNYLLSNNESVQVKEFEEQLLQEKEAVDYYAKALKEHQVPYSIVREYYQLAAKKLTDIDSNQSGLISHLSTLRQQEKGIRDSLDVYELDLRNMKRTVEKYHLPGLQKEYLELFFSTGSKIEQLSQKLNRVKIDMREINQLNSIIEEDIEALDIKTEEIVDNAQLTEYMIQHANRYRLSNPTIESAIEQSLKIFNGTYNYAESLAVIESALKAVEPDAGQRVRSNYESEKRNPFF